MRNTRIDIKSLVLYIAQRALVILVFPLIKMFNVCEASNLKEALKLLYNGFAFQYFGSNL